MHRPIPFFYIAGLGLFLAANLNGGSLLLEQEGAGGENVYPAEVESIMTGHPEVAVVGVPSAKWGESPYAVVVLRPGAQLPEADLISWTRAGWRTSSVRSASRSSPLARTASGRLQKQARPA